MDWRSVVLDKIIARLMEMGFWGVSVLLVEFALLIVLIGKLIHFVQFMLGK